MNSVSLFREYNWQSGVENEKKSEEIENLKSDWNISIAMFLKYYLGI